MKESHEIDMENRILRKHLTMEDVEMYTSRDISIKIRGVITKSYSLIRKDEAETIMRLGDDRTRAKFYGQLDFNETVMIDGVEHLISLEPLNYSINDLKVTWMEKDLPICEDVHHVKKDFAFDAWNQEIKLFGCILTHDGMLFDHYLRYCF